METKRSDVRKRMSRLRFHSLNRMQNIKTKGKKRKNNFQLTHFVVMMKVLQMKHRRRKDMQNLRGEMLI